MLENFSLELERLHDVLPDEKHEREQSSGVVVGECDLGVAVVGDGNYRCLDEVAEGAICWSQIRQMPL